METLAAWGCERNASPVFSATPIPIDQPMYLTNNWKALQGDHSKYNYQGYSRFIKVLNGAATITNGSVIIRSPLWVPDGYYYITETNQLTQEDPLKEYSLSSFPDVEAIRPRFEVLDHTPPIPKSEVLRIVEFLSYVRSSCEFRNDAKVHMIDSALYSVHDSNVWLPLPFSLPIPGDGMVIDCYHLKVALTEMIRYDHVQLGRDNTTYEKKPLVIGLDWNRCSLCIQY